jgi:hypothetical protein
MMAIVASAALVVQVAPPKTTGSKAVIKLELKNTFSRNLLSAVAVQRNMGSGYANLPLCKSQQGYSPPGRRNSDRTTLILRTTNQPIPSQVFGRSGKPFSLSPGERAGARASVKTNSTENALPVAGRRFEFSAKTLQPLKKLLREELEKL